MFELFASRLSRCVVALAIFFAAVAVFVSPASARPHHRHSAERHAYVHHASDIIIIATMRAARASSAARRNCRRAVLANTQASYDPNANSGGMAK